VDPDRRMVAVGLGRADCPPAISAAPVREVFPKALPLLLFFSENEQITEKPGYGQGGLIRQLTLLSRPGETAAKCSVVPVTAKHNLRHFFYTARVSPAPPSAISIFKIRWKL
jgi:hypothetical protein